MPIAMTRRALAVSVVLSFVAGSGCKTNQGNGEAQPQNTSRGYNADNERNNTRKSGTGGPGNNTTPAKPGPDQTPGQPASKSDRAH